jgi:hypothetical protein
MISKIGSLQSSQASTGARKLEAQPATSKARSAADAGNEPAAPKAAAVVQIGGQARTLASQAEAAPQSRLAELGSQRAAAGGQSAARPRLGGSSEARAEIEIEPVVAQPVPDFNSPAKGVGASSASSVYSSSSAAGGGASQAASSGRQFVA